MEKPTLERCLRDSEWVKSEEIVIAAGDIIKDGCSIEVCRATYGDTEHVHFLEKKGDIYIRRYKKNHKCDCNIRDLIYINEETENAYLRKPRSKMT